MCSPTLPACRTPRLRDGTVAFGDWQLDTIAVLQPFVRLENSRNRDTGGTGLGLAIAQQLATAIGGSLALHNRDGGGLVAVVRLAQSAN